MSWSDKINDVLVLRCVSLKSAELRDFPNLVSGTCLWSYFLWFQTGPLSMFLNSRVGTSCWGSENTVSFSLTHGQLEAASHAYNYLLFSSHLKCYFSPHFKCKPSSVSNISSVQGLSQFNFSLTNTIQSTLSTGMQFILHSTSSCKPTPSHSNKKEMGCKCVCICIILVPVSEFSFGLQNVSIMLCGGVFDKEKQPFTLPILNIFLKLTLTNLPLPSCISVLLRILVKVLVTQCVRLQTPWTVAF